MRSSSFCVQIYALDFRHAGKNLQRLGNAPSSDRFHCLSWGILRGDVYHVSDVWHPLLYTCHAAQLQHRLLPSSDGAWSAACIALHEVLSMQDGVIAAGLANGTIEIWDAAKLAAGKGEAARISKLDKHKGPVGPTMFLPLYCCAC